MALPAGDWAIDANGFRGTMTIRGVDPAGNLDASLVIDTPRVDQMIGFWADVAKKITFIRKHSGPGFDCVSGIIRMEGVAGLW
jgi:hypothetical protein